MEGSKILCEICGKPFKRDKEKGGMINKEQTLCNICRRNPAKRILIKKEMDITKAPMYIQERLEGDKEVINIGGDQLNPTITYKCKICGCFTTERWTRLRKRTGHRCVSKGEAMVSAFLIKNKIPYKTQTATLKCINPSTQAVLPYDFEIIGKKVIIEVQGQQHNKYIKYFHGNKAAFYQQQERDKIKRDYAISKGYRFLALYPEDFKSGEFEKIIHQTIKEKS